MLLGRILWLSLAVVILFCDEGLAWGRRRRRRCNSSPCSWTWSSCSHTCGGGTQYPIKTSNQGSCGSCNMPSGTRPCNTHECRMDCSWNTWGSWTICPVTCGGGTQTRIRAAHGPTGGGNPCQGPREETKPCNQQCCPVNCKWSSWEADGSCSATCGGGVQKRSRSYDVFPSCGGASCEGGTTDSVPCNTHCCAQNCEWGSWGSWLACDKPCGVGLQSRSRDVATPASCGGMACQGGSTDEQTCNTQCCVIDCMWDEWGTWTSCTKSCDSGQQARERSAAHLAQCGGETCDGEVCDTRPCNEFCCSSQCEYSVWSPWSACDKSCGTGLQTRQRDVWPDKGCTSQTCLGELSQERNCSTNCCPVDCVLSDWSSWSDCSATCGSEGRRSRSRTVAQEMFCGGTTCDPELHQEQSCNQICFNDESLLTSSGCVCGNGWRGQCCELDINECNTVVCPAHSDCINSDGSFECVCHHNYTKEEDVCLHFDKCANDRHDCHADAQCTMQNMQDYVCQCKPGYNGNGFQCDDIDECLTEDETSGQEAHEMFSGEQIITEWVPLCHADGECVNTQGSYSCQCLEGYVGDGWNCTDFDECAVHDARYSNLNPTPLAADEVDYCSEYANCSNTIGGHNCACKQGYFGDGYVCEEIDECRSDPCENDGQCVNEVDRFSCVCARGYEGDTCLDDVNECERRTADCDPVNGTCINTDGSFVCECQPGFQGDGRTCTDIDECANGDDDCSGQFPICRNVPGHYVCDCEPGSSVEPMQNVPPAETAKATGSQLG